MQGKLSLAAGFVAGYVLGSKAGRQRYEEIVAQARKVAGNQTVQSTAGVLQAQATDLVNKAKQSDVVTKAKQTVSRGSGDSRSDGGSGSSYTSSAPYSTETAYTAETTTYPETSTYETETTPGAASGDLFEPTSTTDPLSPTNQSGTNGSNP